MHLFQSKEKRAKAREERTRAEAEQAAARSEYAQLPARVAAIPPDEARAAASALAENGALTQEEKRSLGLVAVRAISETALADERLTLEEEERVTGMISALGFQQADMESGELAGVFQRILVGKLNDDRLEDFALQGTRVNTRGDEVVYGQLPAKVLKEVATREWQSGTAGVSMRVAKGVRFYSGGTRGRMVQTGTEMKVDDVGELFVTSTRLIFFGQRSTMEIPLAKLLGVDVFSDGIRIHSSNRKTAPLLQFPDGWGETTAAMINAVTRKLAA